MRFPFRKWLLIGVCLVVSGSGCTSVNLSQLPGMTQEMGTSTSEIPALSFEWKEQGVGIDRALAHFSSSTASELILYRFSLAQHRFRFEHSTSTAAVSEWLTRTPEAVFISNGVYFHEDNLPSGWFQTAGKKIGARSFDEDKSALLVLQPEPGIFVSTSTQVKARQTARDAAQSFPLLISRGAAAVKVDSGKASRRTFVGMDSTHTYLYIGVVPYTGISLYELGQALVRLPIKWESVLNLDGGPSSGFAFRTKTQAETIDSYVTVPNVLVVLPKDERQ